MYCTKCGHRNPEDASFCAVCGMSLQSVEEQTLAITLDPHSDEETSISLDGLAPDQALLVVKGGPTAGSTFLIDRDITRAGRHPDSDLFLNDITVSRRHVEIHRDGRKFVLKDAGSLNGTYVERERVEAAELQSGDEIQIGKFKVAFYAAPGGGS